MKKMLIFLSIIVALFIALGIVTKMQNEQKVSQKNPYGKDTLRSETISLLDDPNYQNIIKPTDLEKKLENKEDVTVYFFSPTCGHCRNTTPIVSPLAKDMNVNLVMFNLLEFEDGWDDYGIEETPTIVQYRNGVEVNRIIGYQDKAVFESWFKDNSQ